jgi:aldehyde:ferredoxin oxidoreductase
MSLLSMSLADINLSQESVTVKTISEDVLKKFLGGNGIAVNEISNRLAPGIDAFSPENILVFATGPLTATDVYGNDRLCVAAKSPLTNLFFDSILGGRLASSLKSTGFGALAVTGKAKRLSYLLVSPNSIQIHDASNLQGKSPQEVHDFFSSKYEGCETCAIGIAGENKIRYASIVHSRENNRGGIAGRGGLGAVMGSKNLKAIVIQRGENRKTEISSPDKLKILMGPYLSSFKEKNAHFSIVGTPGGVKFFNYLGGFGTRNLQDEMFEGADSINGDYLKNNYYKKNISCFRCPIACGKLCLVDSQLVKNPELETVYAFGGMNGISNIEAIIRANTLCDKYGMDTISMGVSLAFIVECTEKGLLPPSISSEHKICFGNDLQLVELITDTANRKGIGDLLAEGTRRMAEIIGNDTWKYTHQVKGLEICAHSARISKVLSIGYATNTRGGTHQDARPSYGPGCGNYEGKALAAVNSQHLSSIGDSLILCRFIMEGGLGSSLNETYCDILEAITGWRPSATELKEIGERIVNLERIFNVKEGVNRNQDTLTYRIMNEEIPRGPSKGQRTPPEKLQEMLDEYYSLRGWDKNGIPEQSTLKRLGLNCT